MSAEKVESCSNCSGRGYHEHISRSYDPNTNVYTEIKAETKCDKCNGDGYIIK